MHTRLGNLGCARRGKSIQPHPSHGLEKRVGERRRDGRTEKGDLGERKEARLLADRLVSAPKQGLHSTESRVVLKKLEKKGSKIGGVTSRVVALSGT